MSDDSEKLIQAVRGFRANAPAEPPPPSNLSEDDEFRLLEQVAALVDGECSDDEREAILSELEPYPEMVEIAAAMLSDKLRADGAYPERGRDAAMAELKATPDIAQIDSTRSSKKRRGEPAMTTAAASTEVPAGTTIDWATAAKRRRPAWKTLLPLALAASLVVGFFAIWNASQPGDGNGSTPPGLPAGLAALEDTNALDQEWDIKSKTLAQKPVAAVGPDYAPSAQDSDLGPLGMTAGAGGESVYDQVAPSVVILHSETGMGTGFIVREGGWILTNEHVAQAGRYDEQGRFYINATVGQPDDEGIVRVASQPIRVYVHKLDRSRDLALLRPAPDDPAAAPLLKLKPLTIRTDDIRPDTTVRLVGHASSGTLWSIKRGYVSGVDVIGNLAAAWQLQSQPGGVQLFADDEMKNTMLIESDVVSMPGDSGGPLVGEDAKVVGICFGNFDFDGKGGRNFFIHAKEIEKFLNNFPESPLVRDAFHWAMLYEQSDAIAWVLEPVELEGRPYLLLLGLDADEHPAFYGFGAAEHSNIDALVAYANEGGQVRAAETIDQTLAESLSLQFVWASLYGQRFTTAYAQGNGSSLDSIFIDNAYDGRANLKRTRGNGGAADYSPESGPILRDVSGSEHAAAFANAYKHLQTITEALVTLARGQAGAS